MAWTDVAGSYWLYSGFNYGGSLYTILQYDDSTTTPESVSVRFILRRNTTDKYGDGYAILLNPATSSRKVYVMKPATSEYSWDDNYHTIGVTLTKDAFDAKFSLPAFWFVNTGSTNTSLQKAAKNGDADGVYNYVKDGGVMAGYKTKFAASTWSIAYSSTVAGNVKAHVPKITDHKNSTFSIQVDTGDNGTNNAVSSTTLYYRMSSLGNYVKADGLTIEKKALTCGASAKSQIIWAYSVVTGVYGDSDDSSKTSLEVPNYVIPNAPGKPVLTDDSRKNGRLTIKQPWTYQWPAAAAANTSSPIKGYRIRLYKNNKTIPIKNSSGAVLSVIRDKTEDDYIYDRETTGTNITIDPALHDFKPNDYVKLGIYAYTRNGNDDQLFNGKGYGDAQVDSDITLVQNAGVVNLKTNDGWVEGQVYVKTADGWQEAETVNVKTEDGWQESQ